METLLKVRNTCKETLFPHCAYFCFRKTFIAHIMYSIRYFNKLNDSYAVYKIFSVKRKVYSFDILYRCSQIASIDKHTRRICSVRAWIRFFNGWISSQSIHNPGHRDADNTLQRWQNNWEHTSNDVNYSKTTYERKTTYIMMTTITLWFWKFSYPMS